MAMMSIYVAALLFGGVMFAASLFGGHDGAHVGGAGHGAGGGGGHPTSGERSTFSLSPIFSLRFWIFATTLFGLTGLVLQGLELASSSVTPFIAGATGVACGFTAARLFQRLTRDAVGLVGGAEGLIGREGELLLPLPPKQRSKVRIAIGGAGTDFLAEQDGSDPLPAGATVMVVGVRGTTVVVERGVTEPNHEKEPA